MNVARERKVDPRPLSSRSRFTFTLHVPLTVAFTISASLPGLAACKSSSSEQPPRVVIERILLDLGPTATERLDKAEVRRVVEQALSGSPRFTTGKPTSRDKGWTARIRVDLVPHQVKSSDGGRPAEVREAVQVVLKLWRRSDVGDAFKVEGTAPTPEGAIEQALHRLTLQVSAREKETAKLIIDLAEPDADIRLFAATELGERRSKEAAPALIKLLHDEREEVALRAIGALTSIGDERAVAPLIKLTEDHLTRREAGLFVRQIIYALGAIGGEKAHAYLFTLQTGHPLLFIRRAAREALGELKAAIEEEADGSFDIPNRD